MDVHHVWARFGDVAAKRERRHGSTSRTRISHDSEGMQSHRPTQVIEPVFVPKWATRTKKDVEPLDVEVGDQVANHSLNTTTQRQPP